MGDLDTILLTTSFSTSTMERDAFLDLVADVEVSEAARGETIENAEPWEGSIQVFLWSAEVETWYTPKAANFDSESDCSPMGLRRTGTIAEAPVLAGMPLGVWTAGEASDHNEGFICGRLVGSEYCYFAMICGYGEAGNECRAIIEDSLPGFLFRGSREVPEMLRLVCKNLHLRLREDSELTLVSGASIELIITRGNAEAWICSLGECFTASGVCGDTYAESQLLTKAHLPSDPDEFLRVTANPKVSEVESVHGVNRVFATGCAYPGVTITRGLGNGCAAEICNVAYEPTIVHLDLDPVDFLLSASRGVTEKLSVQTMCTVAMHAGNMASSMPNLSPMAVAEDAATRWRNWHSVAHECSAMTLVVHPDNFTGIIPATYEFGGREGSAVDVVRKSMSQGSPSRDPGSPRLPTDADSKMSVDSPLKGDANQRESVVQFMIDPGA
jgi:serine/threonine protein phosphatase PrpC